MSRREWIKKTRPRGMQWVAVLALAVYTLFQAGTVIGLVVGFFFAWAVVAIYNNHWGNDSSEAEPADARSVQ